MKKKLLLAVVLVVLVCWGIYMDEIDREIALFNKQMKEMKRESKHEPN